MATVAALLKSLALLTATSFAAGCATPVVAEPWRYTDIERVVALADIHGANAAFRRTLQAAGVIDAAGRWIGGTTHLVIVGDVLDRGADSRAALDLIMQLEQQARDVGGVVVLTMGNHELMNLIGDLRYVAPGEYAAFADEESNDDRDAAFNRYAARTGAVRDEFDARFPRGYFAHRAAFRSDGRYGAWLLEKPWFAVIDGTLFVHGGLGARLAEHGPDLDRLRREQLTTYLTHLETLTDAGVLDASVDLDQRANEIRRQQESGADWPEHVAAAAAALLETDLDTFFDVEGALWYRGTVACPTLIERHPVSDALAAVDAQRAVLGHTPTSNGQVLERRALDVTRIDTGMLRSYYRGRGAALIVEDRATRVVYEDGSEAVPLPQSRAGVPQALGADLDAVEALLLSSPIAASELLEAGETLLDLTTELGRIRAVFAPLSGRRSNATEVAAYRLDRMLQLDMVPVTVLREIDGQRGQLRLHDASLINESQRTSTASWCPLEKQFRSMYLFDALIHNQGRTVESIRYRPAGLGLVLVGHGDAFGTSRGVPEYLETVDLTLPDGWRDLLTAVDEPAIRERLADVLDSRRINALLERRQRLLD